MKTALSDFSKESFSPFVLICVYLRAVLHSYEWLPLTGPILFLDDGARAKRARLQISLDLHRVKRGADPFAASASEQQIFPS
jgi:hypothetical protein